MEEIWKDIQSYVGLYQVSSFGRVKSLPKTWVAGYNVLHSHGGKILKDFKCANGYARVGLCKNDKVKRYSVHRLVAVNFLSNPLNKETVNHKNGVKHDNTVDNLEWATQKENIKHAHDYKLSVKKKGENHYFFGRRGSSANRSKIVMNTENGIFYDSAKEAAYALGINSGTLRCYLSGHNRNKTNLIYV